MNPAAPASLSAPPAACWLLARAQPGDALPAVPAASVARDFRSTPAGLVYRFVEPSPAATDPGTALAPDALAAWLLLEPVQVLDGHSAGRAARWRYIVETDIEPDAQADFNAWYQREHLPGLASVPGVARAARFRIHLPATAGSGPGPRAIPSPAWLAAYDLVDPAAFNSPPWLAVRATDWSSRVRPSFRNTRRTMFERLDAA